MTRKPDGFVNFLAWAALLAGAYILAASLFGVIYLVSAGAGAKAIAYALPLGLGIALSVAGYSLMKGLGWSRYVFLALCVLTVVSLYQYLPLLLLLGRVADPAAKASLLSIAFMGLFSLKWVIACIVATVAVFRHFRSEAIELGPTLSELTRNEPR